MNGGADDKDVDNVWVLRCPPPLSHARKGFDFSKSLSNLSRHSVTHTRDSDTRYVSLSERIRHGYVKLPLQRRQRQQRRFYVDDDVTMTTILKLSIFRTDFNKTLERGTSVRRQSLCATDIPHLRQTREIKELLKAVCYFRFIQNGQWLTRCLRKRERERVYVRERVLKSEKGASKQT